MTTTSPLAVILAKPFLAIYSTVKGVDLTLLLLFFLGQLFRHPTPHSREAAGLLPYLISSRNETEETPFSDKHHWMLDANIACGADKGPIDAAEDQRNHFYSRKKKSFFEGKTFLVR